MLHSFMFLFMILFVFHVLIHVSCSYSRQHMLAQISQTYPFLCDADAQMAELECNSVVHTLHKTIFLSSVASFAMHGIRPFLSLPLSLSLSLSHTHNGYNGYNWG